MITFTAFIKLVLAVLFYHRISLLKGTLIIVASLLLAAFLIPALKLWFITGLIIFLLIAIPLNIPSLRRRIITDRIFRKFKSELPSMSSTEEEAIKAGTVWWDGDLFSGKPDWKKLLSFPKPELSEKEEAFMDGPVEELCGMLNDWKITQELQDLPEEVWAFIKEKGFFGMIIPEEYGGLEFSTIGHSAVVMKLASRSITAAVTVMVPNSLGPAELLLRYGTEEQKDFYLPKLAKGEEVPCFGLTGPKAGSDAASLTDSGVVCRGEYNGQEDVLGIRLNWEKRYITLGPVATVLGLAFRLYDPDHLIGGKEDIGITLALIPTDTPGVSIGTRHFPLNSAFQVGPNWGEDVFIPIDKIIGGPERAGEGWRMLMNCLAEGRSVSLPALSTGSCKLAARAVGAYARIRKQFNMPIGKFEGVEEALARIGGYTYITDSARLMTAGGVDLGEEPSVVSAIVKYHLTELTRAAVNDAMDVRGGAGICMGPRNLIGRIYQSLPISITVEGANILTRSMIIFGQGAIRCHPYLLREVNAAKNEDSESGAMEFDDAVTGHAGFIISNAVRSFFLAVTGSWFVMVPGSSASRKYMRRITRMSSVFAFVSDITLLLMGGALKRKERLSARLADALSYLYLASASIKRFEDNGAPEDEVALLDWSCSYSLYKSQEALDELLKNYPVRAVALILRVIIFPLGRRFRHASDRLDHSVARMLMSPSAVRDRLTGGIFIPEDKGEILRRLEDLLPEAIAAEPLEDRLRKAIKKGIINQRDREDELKDAVKEELFTEDDAEKLKALSPMVDDIIRVDDFPKDRWRCADD